MNLIKNSKLKTTVQIDILAKSFDKFYLTQFVDFLKNRHKNITLNNDILEINQIKVVNLPWKRNTYTVLRSPHVNKTARDQFEMRFYKRFVRFELKSSEKLIQHFINILKKNAVGIELKIKVTPQKQ